MTRTAREALDRISRHAHDASLAGVGDGPLAWAMRHAPNRVVSPLVKDLNGTVGALRAVLQNHWCIEGGEDCGYDGRPWPCPDYRAVTDALGGVQ